MAFLATPEAFIELHELFAHRDLRGGVLFLQIVELALRVDDVEKIGEAAIESSARQINGALPRQHRRAQFLHALLLRVRGIRPEAQI
jgi:hypothetical protein